MIEPFVPLALAAACWFAIHPGVAGSAVRTAIVDRFGERAFSGLFSALSIGALSGLIHAYVGAPEVFVWAPTPSLRYLTLVAVPVAFVLLIGAFTVRNPTSVGGEKALDGDEPARGVLRITRHPFLWGVATWAVPHLLVNGDIASLLFFGALATTALVGTRDIDRKRRRSSPDAWARFSAVTSNLPFAAIATRRNRLAWRELALPIVLAAILTAVTLHFHAAAFGVSPLPVP